MEKQPTYRLLISGGGTGGHIYPALAIANTWMELHPGSDILFVGAIGKMEMQKVPEAGYKIVGLPVSGLQRSFSKENLSFPIKLLKSIRQASKIIQDFKPNAVIGVGGYASGPVLFMAQRKGIPTLIQEQNSYAGLTNKLLSKNADKICVAYPSMDKFFPSEKIIYTGNPVRKDILELTGKREKALSHFGLEEGRKTVLILGGSLGARTLNQAVLKDIKGLNKDYQVLWQSGRFYFKDLLQTLDGKAYDHVHLREFIREMDLAYAAADVVVSRAGALSVSELSLVAKPVIFIPSPNVAEDHQTKNAMAYVRHDAAILLKDKDAVGALKRGLDELLADEKQCVQLSNNLAALAKPNAAKEICGEIRRLVG